MRIAPRNLTAASADVVDMKRKLIAFVVLCSLVLSGLSGWAWQRSTKRMDELTFQPKDNLNVRVWTDRGNVLMSRTQLTAASASNAGRITWNSTPTVEPVVGKVNTVAVTAFSYTSAPLPDKRGGMESTLVLPLWLVAAFFAVAPLMWVTARMTPGRKSKSKPAKS
jgi:hypothetical protein